MKYTGILLSAVAALGFIGCQTIEPITEVQDGEVLTLTAIQESDNSRTALSGNDLLWTPGDCIKVFFSGSEGKFISTCADTSLTSEFTGVLEKINGGVEEGETRSTLLSSPVIAIYPYAKECSLDNDGLTATIPAVQNALAGGFKGEYMTSTSKAFNWTLKFYHLNGGIKFKLNRSDVRSVVFKAKNGEALAGKVKLSLDDYGKPSIASASEAIDSLILVNEDGSCFQSGKEYFIVSAPAVLANGFTITIKTADGIGSKTSTGSQEIKRRIFGDLGIIDSKIELQKIDNEINGTKIQDGMNLVGMVREKTTGKAVEGVRVSDGYDIVRTDKNGVYQMKAAALCRNVFITVPSAYQIPLKPGTGLPAHYADVNQKPDSLMRNDFELEKMIYPEDEFSLLIISDPQSISEGWLNNYTNRIAADIKWNLPILRAQGLHQNICCVTCGDIVYENDAMWPKVKEANSKISMGGEEYLPMFFCVGNHDQTVTSDTAQIAASDYEATRLFARTFGPEQYSFDRGNTHVIVVDDAIIRDYTPSTTYPNGGKWTTYTGFTDDKWQWIEKDLANVENKSEKCVVVCLHIPPRDKTGRHITDLYTVLKQFKQAHVMGGHTHLHATYLNNDYVTFDGSPIREHIHNAAFGYFWAMSHSCADGNPEAYYLYSFKDGKMVTNDFKAGNKRATDYQLRVYDGNQQYIGNNSRIWAWEKNDTVTVSTGGQEVHYGDAKFKNAFIVQIFNDNTEDWKVELFQNGVKVGNFHHSSMTGGYNNKCFDAWRNRTGKVLDSTVSNLWYYQLPESTSPSTYTNWEVRATQQVSGSEVVKVYKRSDLTTTSNEF